MLSYRWARICCVVVLIVASAGRAQNAQVDARVASLADQLKSDNAKTRRNAAEALGDLGPAAEKAMGPLRVALRDRNGTVRHYAAWALGKIGPAAAPAGKDLAQRLVADGDAGVRHIAAWAIGEINPSPTDVGRALTKGLADKEKLVRKFSAQAMGCLAPPYVLGVRPLVDAIDDRDDEVVHSAIVALGYMGPDASYAIDRLAKVLAEETSRRIRHAAAMALGRIGSEDGSALPVFLEMLTDESSEVRVNAALAIGNMGPAAESAVDALVDVLDDPDSDVRYGAMVSLGAIGPPAQRAAPALLDAFRADQTARRWDAISALIRMKQGVLAVDDLLQALDLPEAADRREAAVSLCAIGEPARATGEKLKELTTDDDDTVCVAAARAVLATTGEVEFAADVLMDALIESKDANARTDAALGLGLIGYNPPDGVIQSLIYALDRDHHEWVRWQAARSLARYRAQAAEAEPSLSRALREDSSHSVRDAAAYALEEIQKEPEKRTFFGPQFMNGEGGGERPTVGFSGGVVVVDDGSDGTGTDQGDNEDDDEDEGAPEDQE